MSFPSRAGIYVGWTGRANLGDEAMFSVCQDTFTQIHWATFEQVVAEASSQQSAGSRIKQSSRWGALLAEELRTGRRIRLAGHGAVHQLALAAGGEVAIFGGGTLLNDKGMLAEYKAVRQRTGRLVPVFGSGVSDPRFWSADASWHDERIEWVAALAELPAVGVRGPRSKQLLDEAGAKNVIVCGDPAVMLHKPSRATKRDSKKLSVGLNCGISKRAWSSLFVLNNELSDTARELTAGGNSVEVIPVWPDDAQVCKEVAAAAGIRQLPATTTAADFLNLVGKYDIVIATKLHAAVLAAAANVPFIMIEYQPKCRDFTASIGWERFTLRSDAANTKNILEAVYSLKENLAEFRAELCGNMCSLRNQFVSYCNLIRPLLLS
jgi:polysaccharide pyruvyl transferase WcaK-like protein